MTTTSSDPDSGFKDDGDLSSNLTLDKFISTFEDVLNNVQSKTCKFKILYKQHINLVE